MKVLMRRTPNLRSMLVEVTIGITRVFLIPPLGRTFLLVDIVEGVTLVNAIGKLESVLLVEKLDIGLWIA